MNNKITLPELVSALASATSTTKRMSELFIRELISTITQALADNESVTIKDFGQFHTTDSNGKRIVLFTPSKQLAETLNQPFEAFTTVEISDDITDDILNNILAQDTSDSNSVGENDEETDAQNHDKSVALPPPFIGSISQEPTVNANEDKASVIMASGEVEEANQHEISDLNTDSNQPMTSTYKISSSANTQGTEVSESNSTTADKTASTHSFIKGMISGALCVLLLGGLAYWIANRAPVSANVDVAADTTIQQADSVTIKPAAQPVVTDTTSTTMYLTRIARKHYGNADFWIYIYEENIDIIKDPNNIPPGTIVVIPPAEKYGIDASDKRSIEKARKRSFELFSKRTK